MCPKKALPSSPPPNWPMVGGISGGRMGQLGGGTLFKRTFPLQVQLGTWPGPQWVKRGGYGSFPKIGVLLERPDRRWVRRRSIGGASGSSAGPCLGKGKGSPFVSCHALAQGYHLSQWMHWMQWIACIFLRNHCFVSVWNQNSDFIKRMAGVRRVEPPPPLLLEFGHCPIQNRRPLPPHHRSWRSS